MHSIIAEDGDVVVEERLAPMKKQDMSPAQLREYDGVRRDDGRVLMAVLGKIFDVTKSKNFYGPGGPYSAFAGKDASRGLATFNVGLAKEEYDDLSDLSKSGECTGPFAFSVQNPHLNTRRSPA